MATVFLQYRSFSRKFLCCVIGFTLHLFFVYYLFDIFACGIVGGIKIPLQVVSELRPQPSSKMSALRFSKPMNVEIEIFDGRINFSLWQIQIKIYLFNMVTQGKQG